MFALSAVLFTAFLRFTTSHYSESDKPYYIRSKPVKFNQQPLDAVMYPKERSKEVLSAHTFTCNISIEPVACGLKPCLWWYHNGSAVINGSTPEMNIKNSENGDTQLWSQLTTVRAGTYQCVVDDGYFITVSREAHLSLQEVAIELNAVTSNDVEIDIEVGDEDVTEYIKGLRCSGALNDGEDTQNTTKPCLARRMWFVNGKKQQTLNNVYYFKNGSKGTDFVGIYQCFSRNATHERSVTYRLIIANRPNPTSNMTFEVMQNFSYFNLSYVKISWKKDNNSHIKNQKALRQVVQIQTHDDYCFVWISSSATTSNHQMMQMYEPYRVRVISGYYSRLVLPEEFLSESYYTLFHWPNYTTGIATEDYSLNCSECVTSKPCIDLNTEKTLPLTSLPSCRYISNGLGCSFTWTTNSRQDNELILLCSGEHQVMMVKPNSTEFLPLLFSKEHPVPCDRNCTIRNQQRNIVESFHTLKPKPPVLQKVHFIHIDGKLGLSFSLNLPDPQASCGEIHFCKLHINRKPLAADLNCSALNLIKDLFFNFVPLPTIIQLLTHYKSTEISICYISMGGESQMSNSVLLPPSKGIDAKLSSNPRNHAQFQEEYLAISTVVLPVGIGLAATLGIILFCRCGLYTE
jgi:hypothetical protein